MARKSAVPGLPAASDLSLDEFLAVYPRMAGADGDPEPDPEPDPDPEPESDPEPKDELEEWRGHARKHEREAKKLRKELEAERKARQERDDADKSEQDRAIEKAREEARNEALSEAEKERRSDRLEVAVTRLAAKGVTVGDKTVKFADPEDALIFVERAIKAGETEDIFDDEGKVHTDALSDALVEILKRKPNLAADGVTPTGGNDAGKGSGGSGSLSADPADHFERIRKKK